MRRIRRECKRGWIVDGVLRTALACHSRKHRGKRTRSVWMEPWSDASAIVVRRGLCAPVSFSFRTPSSHMSACTEPFFDFRDKFLRLSSVSCSPRGGRTEEGTRMVGSMTNSPRMESLSLKRARKLVGLVLKVFVWEWRVSLPLAAGSA